MYIIYTFKINVAIKHMKSGGNFYEFLKEADIMGKLDHPCIISWYGVCYERQMLVSFCFVFYTFSFSVFAPYFCKH